ncbi:MAG TPA: hypothetical protein DEB40_05565 [Elusimicrobia bacterium]|nr:hypothetical protein [Elusimicrobiota bacterium]HBT61193.1 hypothetical protein [Elusimicrobiota bacterium]
MKKLALAGVLVLPAFLCSGCFLIIGAGAGAGGYSYVKGELSRTYPEGLDAAWSASQKAVASLALKPVSQQKDGLGGKIEAERADGTKIVLKLDPGESGGVTVRVRVGLFGDQKASREILDKISSNLRP